MFICLILNYFELQDELLLVAAVGKKELLSPTLKDAGKTWLDVASEINIQLSTRKVTEASCANRFLKLNREAESRDSYIVRVTGPTRWNDELVSNSCDLAGILLTSLSFCID
jgi:hypothetical protein